MENDNVVKQLSIALEDMIKEGYSKEELLQGIVLALMLDDSSKELEEKLTIAFNNIKNKSFKDEKSISKLLKAYNVPFTKSELHDLMLKL